MYKVYSITRVNMRAQDIQGYTGYTVLLARVNMAKQDIQGYTRDTVLLG